MLRKKEKPASTVGGRKRALHRILVLVKAADQALTQAATKETMVGIFIIKGNNVSDELEDIRIVFMGLTVLLDLDNVAFAAAMLIGLM
ncbi:hypothetical protein SKAU_G00233960 [Synaphobranchus kaupii]|uniref:Uncharacterized protein n=1 Tax=Synaphobranchus kaupii TaxID=118154 RepID=A0A9Q1F6B2_SYNKA|nr:hypothetical protein SKAU_G00233960 [Synaphobranchus kaupii]